MKDLYLHLYTNCSNLMSVLSDKVYNSRRKEFQLGSYGSAVGEQDQFVGGRKR